MFMERKVFNMKIYNILLRHVNGMTMNVYVVSTVNNSKTMNSTE